MTKLDTLLACLPDAPFRQQLKDEIESLRQDNTNPLHLLAMAHKHVQPANKGGVNKANTGTFSIGERVRKTKGSRWQGNIVGTYSTALTPEGYAVESETEIGSVQIYPVSALELVPGEEPST